MMDTSGTSMWEDACRLGRDAMIKSLESLDIDKLLNRTVGDAINIPSLPDPKVEEKPMDITQLIQDTIQHHLKEQTKIAMKVSLMSHEAWSSFAPWVPAVPQGRGYLYESDDETPATVINSTTIVIDEQTRLLPCGSEETR